MEINIVAPISYTGYGVVGRNLVCALDNAGHKINLWPIGPVDCPQRQVKSIQKCVDNTKNFNHKSPCLRIWHQNDMGLFAGSPRMGYTFFELNKLKDEEIHHLSQLDYILVASKWAVDILKGYDLTADVLPCGVDTKVFCPGSMLSNKCIFFNAGKFEVRKGHLELAQAFNSAFRGNNNVELWMCCDNRFYRNGENDWWKNYYRDMCGDQVKFIPWQATDYDMAKIMQRTTCGVFPAKAEGWNLELLEMMSCGKPVIATDYSGHTEFCNNDNSQLIPVSQLEPAFDGCPAHPQGFWFRGFGEWAVVTPDLIAEQMTTFYKNWLTNKGLHHYGIDTAKKYNWDSIAETFVNYTSWR